MSEEARELLAPLSAFLAGVGATTPPDRQPAVSFQACAVQRSSPALASPKSAHPSARKASEELGLEWLSARGWAGRVASGELNLDEAVGVLLERINAYQPVLNAFITVAAQEALAAAAHPLPGPLAGVPMVLKDMIDTAQVLTTCGSEIYRARVPDRDAACWERLRNAGALLLGKANTHEFAAGVTSINDFFGAVHNPWDPARSPGGSSGGSAAAVAAGLAPAALGSDTGGSIRIPASCCGVVGLKPTFGRVPVDGVHPLAWSLDTVGPITRDVADASLLLDALSRSSDCGPAAEAGSASSLEAVTVAIPALWVSALDEGLARQFWLAVEALKNRGAHTVEVGDLPSLDLLLAVNRVIAYAEGSAAHSYLYASRGRYGSQIRARMAAGRYISAEQYLLAQRLRGEWCERLERVWAQAEVLVTPTLPCAPPELSAQTTLVGERSLPLGSALVWFTGPFNLAGTPTLSLPTGLVGGLPVGLQLVGPPHEDALVVFVAAACEDELAKFPHPPLATRGGS